MAHHYTWTVTTHTLHDETGRHVGCIMKTGTQWDAWYTTSRGLHHIGTYSTAFAAKTELKIRDMIQARHA